MFTIVFTHSYERNAAKFLKKHADLINRYQKTLELLRLNPFHPSLRLHGLKGRLKGLYSVSLSMQYRISIEFMVEKETVIPIDIGEHDIVYR